MAANGATARHQDSTSFLVMVGPVRNLVCRVGMLFLNDGKLARVGSAQQINHLATGVRVRVVAIR